ncbi:cytochrome P450 oxidoreductase, partial [Mollisia scopiformis]
MTSPLAFAIGGLVSTYVFLRLLLHYTQDGKEPPVVATTIPFISPILGMAKKKTHFYAHIRDKFGLPIYTLRMPGTRIYVVNSTTLITAVQRQPTILAFPPIETKAAINVMGASEAGKEMLLQNTDPNEGNLDKSYEAAYSKAIHPVMSLGADLDSMSRAAIKSIADSLNGLARNTPQVLELFDWVRHEVSSSTAESVYGPMNPFRDSAIEAAFWRFGPGVITLMINIFPSVLARESLKARELMVEAFDQYFRNGGHKQGSALIRARYDYSMKYNVSMSDLVRFEIGGAVAIFANTGPAAFWLIYHIFSDPIILDEIRSEVSKIVVHENNGATIDISDVKTSCPILLSTFQEVLRFQSIGTSARVVMEDHMLDGKYLLKKGGTVMIPGTVQHTIPSVWGDNVSSFDHKRFVRSGSKKRPNPVAFRGFGGGTTLCPGRHFASTEILAFATLMVLRFEIIPVGGKWSCPTTEKAEMWATVPQPDMDIVVEVKPRKE